MNPAFADAQSTGFDWGNIFFSVSPRILQNGSITDVGAGYRYTERYSSRLHFRFSHEEKNVPLLDPHYADYAQQKFGSPYVYADVNIVMFKYFALSCLYDFSRLEYQVIDFDDNLNWYNPSRMVFSNAIKLEASLLVPIMNAVSAKIGFGYSWNSIQLDTASPVWSRQYYFVFDTKVNQL